MASLEPAFRGALRLNKPQRDLGAGCSCPAQTLCCTPKVGTQLPSDCSARTLAFLVGLCICSYNPGERQDVHTIHNTSKCGGVAREGRRSKTYTGPLCSTTSPILIAFELGMNGELGRKTWIQGAYLGIKPWTLSSQELDRLMRAEIKYGDVGYITQGAYF